MDKQKINHPQEHRSVYEEEKSLCGITTPNDLLMRIVIVHIT